MDNSYKIATLIDKLKDQYNDGVPHAHLLATTQMLLAELTNASNSNGTIVGSAMVYNPFIVHNSHQKSDFEDISNNEVLELNKQTAQTNRFTIPKLDLLEIPFLRDQSEVKVNSDHSKMHEIQESIQEPLQISTTKLEENVNIQQTLHSNVEPDINMKLKEEKVELASLLNASPLSDLRNAVGINDRFVFIQELFNADETMYERCIKTINAFTNFSEAESWIQRELKVKLGWKENSAPVVHFDQLVKRRFS